MERFTPHSSRSDRVDSTRSLADEALVSGATVVVFAVGFGVAGLTATVIDTGGVLAFAVAVAAGVGTTVAVPVVGLRALRALESRLDDGNVQDDRTEGRRASRRDDRTDGHPETVQCDGTRSNEERALRPRSEHSLTGE